MERRWIIAGTTVALSEWAEFNSSSSGCPFSTNCRISNNLRRPRRRRPQRWKRDRKKSTTETTSGFRKKSHVQPTNEPYFSLILLSVTSFDTDLYQYVHEAIWVYTPSSKCFCIPNHTLRQKGVANNATQILHTARGRRAGLTTLRKQGRMDADHHRLITSMAKFPNSAVAMEWPLDASASSHQTAAGLIPNLETMLCFSEC